MDFDYETYDREVNKIREINKAYLTDFEQWLKNKGLTEKTIYKHVKNVEFYINDFLCYYDALDVKHGCYEINHFLGGWFIRKTSWASCGNIKSNAASIKKFYEFMLEKAIVEQVDYHNLCETIKDEMPEWLEEMNRYDSIEYDW